MVRNRKQDSAESRAKQAQNETHSRPNKIGASTPYDFHGKNLTPYGGLLPVATMIEKIGFQRLVEETLTVKRITKAMSMYQFVPAIVLGLYVGFSQLNQLRYIARDPLLAGIVKVAQLPGQSTLWRFLNSLHLGIASQILAVQRKMREAVWAAGNIVLKAVTIDTDTTVHTLYGKQMGARKSYNPKNKGKKSYQPILSFLTETKEFIGGELRNGDRPTAKQIARHLQEVFEALPACVVRIFARADSGFYCWEAVEAYEKFKVQFIIVARKTSRLLEELVAAKWEPSPGTDADEQCEFMYQPEGWKKPYRFVALRYEKDPDGEQESEEIVQYQLFGKLRPVVQGGWIKVCSVGPYQSMHLGVNLHLVEKVRIPQRTVYFPKQERTEINGPGDSIIKLHSQRIGARDLKRADKINCVTHKAPI